MTIFLLLLAIAGVAGLPLMGVYNKLVRFLDGAVSLAEVEAYANKEGRSDTGMWWALRPTLDVIRGG